MGSLRSPKTIAMRLTIGGRWVSPLLSPTQSFYTIKREGGYTCISFRWFRLRTEATYFSSRRKISIGLWVGYSKPSPLCRIFSQQAQQERMLARSTKSTITSPSPTKATGSPSIRS